ncbi:MAG TPA: hypothetical protein VG756_22050 [Pseudonocardiaceae bacterium]|nr:hypothetical protein [Pseudonocardiaceae bacterium]
MTAADDADRQWAHTLLARAMDDEPELQLRAEEVLTSGRRSLGRRRAALTGAITVVALAATGILLSLADSARSGAQTAHQGQPALSTTAPAAPETTLYGAEGPLILDAHSRVMTTELAGAHAIPAGVRASEDKYYGGQPLVFYKIINGQYPGSYYAQATLTDSHGAGYVDVQVLRAGQQAGLNCVGIPDPPTCQTQTLPDGSHLTARLYTQNGPGKQTQQWLVELVHPNGTAVDAGSGNWSMDGDPAVGGIDHATGAQPPLSEAALIHLAELPGLIP